MITNIITSEGGSHVWVMLGGVFTLSATSPLVTQLQSECCDECMISHVMCCDMLDQVNTNKVISLNCVI